MNNPVSRLAKALLTPLLVRTARRLHRGSPGLLPRGGLSPEPVAVGRQDPTAGWVSHRYGDLLPAPQLRFQAAGLTFDSALLWLRVEGGRPTALRWVDGGLLRAPRFGLEVEAQGARGSIVLEASPRGLEVTQKPAGIEVQLSRPSRGSREDRQV